MGGGLVHGKKRRMRIMPCSSLAEENTQQVGEVESLAGLTVSGNFQACMENAL